jgi:hypothetical protein
VRPNQLFAAHFGLIDEEDAKKVISVVRDRLLIPGALRSLAPGTHLPFGDYHPYYPDDKSQDQRDEAYHNGTGWVWLYPFYWVNAVRYGIVTREDAEFAMVNDLAPLMENPFTRGSLPELIDAESRGEQSLFAPKGANQQAWSVAAALWGMNEIKRTSAINRERPRQIDTTSKAAGSYLTRDANALAAFQLNGLTPEYTAGREYKMQVDHQWSLDYPEQFEMIEEWWEALRSIFPRATFSKIIPNRSGKNGLIKIIASEAEEYDHNNGMEPDLRREIGSSSVTVEGTRDIGYRMFRLLNIAFAASNITDEWNGNNNLLIDFINEQHGLLQEANVSYIQSWLTESEKIDKARHIFIYLPPIQRLDFDNRRELEMAKEALRAV